MAHSIMLRTWRPVCQSLKNKITILSLQQKNLILSSFRYYLLDNYKLEDKWNRRFEDKFLKEIKTVEFYYDIIRKYKKEGRVAAIDADIFFNSIDRNAVTSLSDEIDEVLRLLRRSPETIHTLDSTSHCIIRNFLSTSSYYLLLKFVSDHSNYGIFLDSYLANLVMDQFLTEKNYTGAARTASSLMLQEDFGSPLTKSLVLLSGFQYAFNIGNNEDWVDYNPSNEPEEEVKILVKYIRNPYFDDHFDLKNPLHIVGKTLAWLSPSLDEPFKMNAEALGWSLFNKWKKLEESLATLLEQNKQLDNQVHSIIMTQIEENCEGDTKAKLLSLLTGAKSRSDKVTDLNIIRKIEEYVNEQVKGHEEEDIATQTKIYDNYPVARQEAVNRQLELYEQERLVAEIEVKKKELKAKEEVIFFFDNEDKIDMELFKKRQQYPVEELEKEKAQAMEEEYISPEVKRRKS